MADPPIDPLATILKQAALTQTQRADIWDAFQSSTSTDDLAERLKALGVPNRVKADLWDLKAQGESSDRPPNFKATNEPPSPSMWQQAAEGVGHAAAGAVRGAVSTVQTLAKPIRWATGMPPATPPPAEATWAGTLGRGAEQVGELLIPAGKLATAGDIATAKLAPYLAPAIGRTAAKMLPRAAVEAAGQAGMAAAQGGDPRIGALGGAITPGVGAAVEALPASLKAQALKQVSQALGPTKERFKAIAQKLAPQILERGLGGSRVALQEQAATTLTKVGAELDGILAQHATQPVSTAPVIQALETAKNAFRTTGAAGNVVEYEPRVIKQLAGLQQVLTDLGPTPTVEQLVGIRRAWDTVVSQAGGFEHRAPGAIGVPLKDISEAWAKREATGAIRAQLAQDVPDLAAINKEWSFWKGLDDVLRQTLQRKQPHGASLKDLVVGIGGASVGASAGAALGLGPAGAGATALGSLAVAAKRVMESPQWKFASANLKNDLADAIVSNNGGRIAMALSRIGAVQGSKMGVSQ